MKVRLAVLASLFCAVALIASFSNSPRTQSQKTPGNDLVKAEQDLLNEINLARAKPKVYASYLEGLKPLFNGKMYTPAGKGPLATEEGWSAVAEAITFLLAANPQGPLSPSIGLRLAAEAHCQDQSESGATGHKGGGGLIEDRVKPFGTWQGGIGENLSYGDDSARERVLTWLIDDGVASRGHRKRLLSADYKVAGIACASHPEFGKVCALALAGGFKDSAAALKNRAPTATLAVTPPKQSSSNTSAPKTSTNDGATNINKSGETNANKSKTTPKRGAF